MSTQTIDSTDLNSSPTRRPGESPRQQSVCIEIPVSVHGSRSSTGSLNNSQAAKPFLEETRTMIVFPSGAVLRLTESVSEGQILILKNARVKQEVACRVVSSKTNASTKGYVEVEFFQAAPGFWGITFPAGSSSPAAEPAPAVPAPRQNRVEPSAVKPAFFQPPVAPVISKPAPASAASILEPPAPPVSTSFNSTPTVASPTATTPFVAAPIVSSPIAPLTPDSTQELNAAIAAAYRTPVEPVKPIKKSEPAHEAMRETMPVKDFVAVAAPPSPSITDPVPGAPNKSLNPTKPKSAQTVKASPESFSSSEPLPMAESIGDPSSEFSAYSKPENSAKQARASAPAISSAIETRKVELTSSQIASEAVLGKPMFGTSAEVSSTRKSGSSRTWIIAVAATVILTAGAGAFWWTSNHKLGATKSVAAAAPETTPPVVPAGNAQPATAPVGTSSQPLNNPASAQNSVAVQKPVSTPSGPAVNSLAAKTDKSSPIVNSHRPTVLSSEKIAAPVTHASGAAISATPAPDVIGKTTSAPGASLSAILPGMGQPSFAPAPPPASKPSGAAPVSSVLQQPKLLRTTTPVYPKVAAIRGDWGNVVIYANVSETGKVTDASVVSGAESLRQSALQVVRTQTYQPAKLNGQPVSMHVTVTVSFPNPR
jgi:periplasmic protein TonB